MRHGRNFNERKNPARVQQQAQPPAKLTWDYRKVAITCLVVLSMILIAYAVATNDSESTFRYKVNDGRDVVTSNVNSTTASVRYDNDTRRDPFAEYEIKRPRKLEVTGEP